MNRIISKVKAAVKRFKIGRIFVSMAKHEYISCDEKSTQMAMEYLNEYSIDPAGSCITSNNVVPAVDLHIIIPAYNVERYICQCMESIVNSPKKISYHLTVVNDGSTDSTGTLLEKYSSIPEVEIITQINAGFSGARNRALKK